MLLPDFKRENYPPRPKVSMGCNLSSCKPRSCQCNKMKGEGGRRNKWPTRPELPGNPVSVA